MDFFRVYKAQPVVVPTYFIESTAPDNVDDTQRDRPGKFNNLTLIENSGDAVKEIAQILSEMTSPNLVVMVHGFNNPAKAVLKTYTAAAEAIASDKAITDRKNVVCVGYRWPSESMGMPRHGTWDALPTLPTWILYIGLFLSVAPFVLFYIWPYLYLPAALDFLRDFSRLVQSHLPERFPSAVDFFSGVTHFFTMVGLTFVGLVLTAALLRLIVYFRDNYRASNYGIPDLVQIIRAIDGKIAELRDADPTKSKAEVHLSFIGHSMGGFVVTNTVRVLSDAFSQRITDVDCFGAGSTAGNKPPPPSPKIGEVFTLKRFLLASPDIPAETLLSGRSNFLASALSRFDEAYLFSNEGDEVLRQISTLANYFSFPTKGRDYGFRLGNVEILSDKFGIVPPSTYGFLHTLRVGNRTVQELDHNLEKAKKARHGATADHAGAQEPRDNEVSLPTVFTYFDCTDYVDRDNDDQYRPLLTFAKCRKRHNSKGKLRWYSHLHLLFSYLAHHQRPNVHGGYFEGKFSQQLMYRLACLGYDATKDAYFGEQALSELCKEKQIRGLLSPYLPMGGYRKFLERSAQEANRPVERPEAHPRI